MPRKNSIKTYVDGGYYHLYNRGVEKRTIFQNKQDYNVFLRYLKQALVNPKELQEEQGVTPDQGLPLKRLPKNFHHKVELLSFCLMPNHFHLLVKLNKKEALGSFMGSLITRYSMYFNKRYDRVGSLFQGVYKAILIQNEAYLLHLTRYIHLNPLENTGNIHSPYSSYQYYLNHKRASWVNIKDILSFFNSSNLPELKTKWTYKQFVEQYKTSSERILGKLTLE